MKIIVERHISGKDYRLFVIGDQLRAAALRIPAHVVGDGKSSIGRLITQKNVTRKANPYSGAKGVKLTAAVVANLEKLGLTGESVVPDGRRVTLQTVANIGAGGERRGRDGAGAS
jgi:D-alanine-D-alanine ligase-like ATP-grasp enzyme